MFKLFVVAAALCCIQTIHWTSIGQAHAQSTRAVCHLQVPSKIDCGYPGISRKKCEDNGCCFNRSIRSVNWCFHSGTCSMKPSTRTDCGYPGMKRDECEKRGCCWDDTINGVHWCFHPGTTCSSVPPPSRVDCGYPGIKALECAKKGCCWDSKISGVNWCFYPAGIMCSSSEAIPTSR